MNKKEKQRRMAYEALVILSALFMLLFICRLWPLILLVILGIFIATLRLLFLSSKQVEQIEPLALPAPVETEDLGDIVFGAIQRRITDLVCIDFPDARWTWETPHAKEQILNAKLAYILLNGAGGFRRACVIIRDLHVCALAYDECPSSVAASDDTEESGETEQPTSRPKNHEYLAFTWVESHIMEINTLCNEAIAQGKETLLLSANELPDPNSWNAICDELAQNDVKDALCVEDGIMISLKPMITRKD